MFGLGPHMRTMLVTVLAIGVAFGVYLFGHHDGYTRGFQDGRGFDAPVRQSTNEALLHAIDREAVMREEIARLRATTRPVTEASR